MEITSPGRAMIEPALKARSAELRHDEAGPVRADALLMQAEGLVGLDRGQDATSALEQATRIPLQPNERFMLAGLAEKVMATWPDQAERCRALLTP